MMISKAEFEQAVPVARAKDNSIFAALESHIDRALDEMADELLGAAGQAAVSRDPDGRMAWDTRQLACLMAFVNNFRGLDLVLTNTGFGVVSTQSLTPASRQRVESLLAQLRWAMLSVRAHLITLLMDVDGWMDTPQRRRWVGSLLWSPVMAAGYGLCQEGSCDQWRQLQPAIHEADMWLRQEIGDGQTEALIDMLRPGSNPTLVQVGAVRAAIQLMVAHVSHQHVAMHDAKRQLMGIMENSIGEFAAYQASPQYEARHQKGYENTEDAGVFFFQG